MNERLLCFHEGALKVAYVPLCDAGVIHYYQVIPGLCGRDPAAGTFDAATGTGGPTGTIRFPGESRREQNSGLGGVIGDLEDIIEMYPGLSYADLYQLARVPCSVDLILMKGPTLHVV